MGCGASVDKAQDTTQGSRAAGDGPMESYPPAFAAEVQSIAQEGGLLATGDESQQAEVEESLGELKGMGVLSDGACETLKDMALTAGKMAAAEIMEEDGLEERKAAFTKACARPGNVSTGLWKRTTELFESAARWCCAKAKDDTALAAKQKKAFDRHARAIKGFGPGKGPKDPQAFQQRASEVMPSNVIMFSGCKDDQTSADVHNTASFGLPADAGPGGAGGACTNSMIKSLHEKPDPSWAELLKSMRGILNGKYTQIPQMSSSKAVDLNTPFSVKHHESNGKFKALLVGINYPGTNAELNGCHNDVETMKRYLADQGYEEENMKILLDDGDHDTPNKENIEAGMDWLVDGAEAGDSLFFHYSGHGASVRDDDGDEADGKDEALCPGDYNSAGLLRDDEVFKFLVAPLKEGVKLTCVLDCCHSGTILDLPFMFKADDASLEAVSQGQSTMQANPFFDFGKILQVFKDNPKLMALGAAAAAAGGIALMFMGKERRNRALNMAGGEDQLKNAAMGMVGQHLGGNEQLLNLAKGFLG
mmetsp:Transcript_131296/g.365978  ORF Transcript_131296/g.365978 Transcript_131296/m.365978 type:complete len:534 (-) Transcript_131296:197-1798(-)